MYVCAGPLRAPDFTACRWNATDERGGEEGEGAGQRETPGEKKREKEEKAIYHSPHSSLGRARLLFMRPADRSSGPDTHLHLLSLLLSFFIPSLVPYVCKSLDPADVVIQDPVLSA